MKHNFNSEDIEPAKEIGFKIHEIEDRGSDFQVEVRYPDSSETREFFTFSKKHGWHEDVEYVENGEKKRKPRWKRHIEDKMQERLDRIQEADEEFEDKVKSHEGETLDL